LPRDIYLLGDTRKNTMKLYKILDSIVNEGEESYWEKYDENPADNYEPFDGAEARYDEIESMFLAKGGKGLGPEGTELVKNLVDEDGLDPRQANAAVINFVPLFLEKLDFDNGKASLPISAADEIIKEKNIQVNKTITAIMDAIDNAIRFVL
jgi:hypothetical protein